jgi:hypothetical protein
MTHRRHAMDNDQYWDHRPGDVVQTVDGYPGTVIEVSDGPVPGNENYRVELHNGMGGGDYSSGQLSALHHPRTASGHEAAGLHVASEDYEELGTILYDRPDPGKLTFAAAQQAAEAPEEGAQLRDTDQPDSCSYCGSQDFTGQTDNGRVKQATCATCGGTMSAHPGAQWTPELIGDPSNHPSATVDPASGASGAGGQAGINDLIDFDARVSTAAALHEAGAKENDQVRESGLPLLSHDDSPGERFDKLSQHYEHLSHRYEDNSDYADEDHPLAAHHREHGVPRFNFRTLADVRPDAKAAVATHLSGNIRRMSSAVGHHIGWPSVNIEHPHDNAGLPDNALGMYGRGDITIRHDLAHDEHEGNHPDTPWFAKSGARSLLGHVTAHEFGHFMDDKQFGDRSLKSTTARSAMLHDVSRHIPGAEPFHGMGHGKDADDWVQRNREHIINHVGTYAATSPNELVAELYAEHHHSPNPSPAAQAVGHHLEGIHDDEAAERGTAPAAAHGAGGQGADARGAAGAREGGAGLAGTAAALNTTAALAGHDWCTWRREARCTFPGDSTAVSLAIPQDRGPCPWETPWQQQVCPISEPGPMALMHAKGSLTAEGAIPAGPCPECGGKGHYDIEEPDPSYQEKQDIHPDEDPDAYRMRRETCEDCGGTGHADAVSDEELAQQRVTRAQSLKSQIKDHLDRVDHPDGVKTKYCTNHLCPYPSPRASKRPGIDLAEVMTPERQQRRDEAMKQRAEQLARTPQSTAALHRIAAQMRTALGTED